MKLMGQNKIENYLFFFTLLFLPFLKISLPFGLFDFTISDILLLLCFIVIISNKIRISKHYLSFFWAKIVFLLSVLLSFTNAIDLRLFFISILPWIYSLLLVIVIGHVFYVSEKNDFYSKLKITQNVLFFSLILISLPVYLEYFGGIRIQSFYKGGYRYCFLTKNPNQLIAIIVFYLFIIQIISFNFIHKTQRYILPIQILLCLPVLATGSRTGTFVFVSISLITLIITFFNTSVFYKLSILVILFSLLQVSPDQFNKFIQQSSIYRRAFSSFEFVSQNKDLIKDGSATGKSMEVGIRLFRQYPIFGIGIGNMTKYQEHEVHNSFIAILSDTGIIGTLGFSILGIILLMKIFLIRNNFKYFIIHFIYFLLFLIMNTTHMQIRQRWTWIYLGLVVILTDKKIFMLNKNSFLHNKYRIS